MAEAFLEVHQPSQAGPKLSSSLLWNLIRVAVWVLVAVLVIETVLRVIFPWDVLVWQESSFLVNLMKLNSHLPVQTAPQDCNSIIYSPGDEYLTYFVLKPFGLALDFRCYRVVNTLLCMLAAGFGALTASRFLGAWMPGARKRSFFAATWGILWLVLSQNFESDMPHADNLHALHAAAVLFLCYAALETRKFHLALAAMLVGGAGIFTKQTEAASWLGPGLVFVIFNPWGWRRALALLAVGGVVSAISLYLLWLPQYGKFYTFTLLSHDPVELFRISDLVKYMFSQWRAVLVPLALVAAACLWTSHGAARRYLICWGLVGGFTAAPGLVSFLKVLAIYNNLILSLFWMMLIVWPVMVALLSQLDSGEPAFALLQTGPFAGRHRWAMPAVLISLFLVLLAMLFPRKPLPHKEDYAFCQAVDAEVQKEVQAGHRILISFGTGFYVRAGITAPPLDQGISVIEFVAAGRNDLLSAFKARVDSHYYDKIFLICGNYYGDQMMREIAQNYGLQSTIPCSSKLSEVMGDCQILVPRQ